MALESLLESGQGNYSDSTLLIPCPNSIAYLGSLVVDLLIASLGLTRVCILSSDYLVGFAGVDAYDSKGFAGVDHKGVELVTALEVFQSSDAKLTLVQVRSKGLKGQGCRLAQQLGDWIASKAFKETVLLTGLDSSRRNDAQIQSSLFRYHSIKSSHESTLSSHLPLESYEYPGFSDLVLPPGAGIGNALLTQLKLNAKPCLVLSWFGADGDNYNSAHQFARHVSQVLDLGIDNWAEPASWRLLYGDDAPKSLY